MFTYHRERAVAVVDYSTSKLRSKKVKVIKPEPLRSSLAAVEKKKGNLNDQIETEDAKRKDNLFISNTVKSSP